MSDEPIQHTLKKPIEHNGKTYSDLTFREVEAGDFMAADQFTGQMSKTIVILACMADVPLPAFRRIKGRDLNAIIDKTKDLLGNEEGSTTGE
ncbi:phage tail assembly protein [Rhizobium leguminosarum]|uniref:phage tail assembly protein n=1 Tax=Rhizobium leguminosarum TaxID=384 RepID=UPI000B925C23|nr:phage tail assembly protein [Rhizobium leguminosarum]ASS56891.1 hypothetical protein CHR56_21335 [Rhizobium leguminosarum bv. viciae]